VGRNVLVADDEPDIVELLEVLLVGDDRCISVTTAGDLEKALTAARDDCPDSIVLDLMFGHRNCAEILPKLRASCPAARIVVFTASARAATAANVLELGADTVRQKVTVSFEDLVDEVLAAKSTSA
jgi:DNA-binding response OmpR family regulator